MTEETIVNIERKEKANSYEFGKASNRFKLFFETPEELKAQMDKLRQLGFMVDEI